MHGTHGTRVSRNVAFDITGHCFYLEDGVEERNMFEYNLATHIHFLTGGRTPDGLLEGLNDEEACVIGS